MKTLMEGRREMTDFTSVGMLTGIKAVLERENGRTELKDGMLECRLRDQFDGGQTVSHASLRTMRLRCPS